VAARRGQMAVSVGRWRATGGPVTGRWC